MRRIRRSARLNGIRAMAFFSLAMLITTACAGSVGKYRNAISQTGNLVASEQAAELPPGAEQVPGVSGGAAAAAGSVTGAAGGGGQAAASGGGPTGGGEAKAPPARAVGKGSAVGITKDTIAIGLMYPQTGAYTGLARNAAAATRAAFEEAGPIHGRRLVLNTYDDGTANPSTIQASERRAKDESFAIMSVVSESNVVLGPLANQHRLPALLGNMDEKVALPLTYVFALATYWRRQAAMLPTFIRTELKGGSKRIGVVYETSSTAKAAKDAFKAEARRQGMNVVYEQPLDRSPSTCANEASNLQARTVELVFMMNGPLGALCMLRDARALGYRPTWTGVGLSWSFNIVAQASGGTADGIRTLNSFATLDTPAGQHYSKVMREHNVPSDVNDDIIMLAYGLVQTMVTALRRAGPNLTREAFVRTMETKMAGYNSGYYPPARFAPGDRTASDTVSFSQCCGNGQWTTPKPGWRRL